jgi:hypothetical protein
MSLVLQKEGSFLKTSVWSDELTLGNDWCSPH